MTRNPNLPIAAVSDPIKVALLSDDPLLRAGLSSLLAQLGSIDVVEHDRAEVALWDAGQRAVLAAGGNLSHHHGVGLNRARFMAGALGAELDVLQRVKDALDPNGILNPGKLGLRHPFDAVVWP